MPSALAPLADTIDRSSSLIRGAAEGASVYLGFKLLHILAVVMFLGNVTTGLFWKAHGDRSRDPGVIAHMMDGIIIRSDRLFTIPGVLFIVASGVTAAIAARLPILGTPWIAWSIALFLVSGVVFVWRIAPLQGQLRDLARAAVGGAPMEWDRYHAVSRRWERWGLLALITPLAAMVLMVLKPT
jgi:uncharacterized membrane protein